jgi:hypothetical protein
MDVYETDDVRILYFDPIQTYLVPHLSRSFHNSLEFQKETFDWEPWEKTTLILSDLSDYGNAGAGVSPYNAVVVDIAPLNRTLETLPGSERTFMVMNHELVHVATMDGWNSQDRFWRKFLMGKPIQSDKHPESILYNYLTAPRRNTPRWYTEGSAVFLDTWMSGGIGRAQGAYDEMVFRSMVRDDAYFYSNLGIVSEGIGVDFQVGVNAYLYGARFISYLAYEHSPEKVLDWLKRPEGSERYYSKRFREVFGITLEAAWDNWIVFEKNFQQANLDRVRQKPLTKVDPIIDQTLGQIARGFLTADESRLIVPARYPGVVAHIASIDVDSGAMARVTDVKGPNLYPVTSPALDPASNTLFYTTDNTEYRDLASVNLATGEQQVLIDEARVGDIAFNHADRSIWGLRHLNGYVSIVRIPYPYNSWNELYTFPYGQVAYELDVSHDGRLVSMSKATVNGTQFLQVYETAELMERNAKPTMEFNFGPSIPEGFVFSKDDKFLYGSSFITGVSNILRYELATGGMEAVTNAETGFFRPIPREDGSLIVFEYTGKGFVPTVVEDPKPLEELSAIVFLGNEIIKKHPVLEGWNVVPSFRKLDVEDIPSKKGKYRPRSELGLRSAYPVVEGYKDDAALGWHFNFGDPANFNSLEVTASATVNGDSPGDETFHFNMEYQFLNWNLRYWHNDADFYDLFGPTKYARKGDAFMIGYERTLVYDKPRQLKFRADLDYFTGLDTLPSNQNVAARQFEDILKANVGLNFENFRKSLGAVDHEKGAAWEVDLTGYDVEGDTVAKLRAGLDFGFALDWKHSSIWFYNAGGVASGESNNPLTSYYFGAFGNNYVDNGNEKRYREPFSMPGFEIDEIDGKRFSKHVVEWNLPPIRFREVGSPEFFLSWIRPALFTGSLWTNDVAGNSRRVNSAGMQLDLHFTLAHRLSMTLSAGYAAGFESGRPDREEWMLSLKVL